MDIREQINRLEAMHVSAPELPSCKLCGEAADTMEAMLEVVEAADLCKRVGYYAQDLNTGRFAGDILMDALDKLKALQTNDD